MPDLNAQQGLIYEGNIHAQRYIGGVLGHKAIGPFEVTALSLTVSNEVQERRSRLVGQSGKVRGSFARSNPTQISLSANAANADLYALFLLGSVAAHSLTGGTVTAESVASMEHDKWYKLAQANVSAVVIATRTLGIDYEVDARLGMIRSLSTGAIANNATVLVNYSYGAISGTSIRVGTESKVDVRLLGRLVNSETGAHAILDVPKVTLSPDGDIALIGDDYQTMTLTGSCVLMDGESADLYLRDPVTYT
ncbi:MAG: hypothetical protein CTY22_05210 [Methylomonas sp.]|nr:MAG: hypothetical protein CTY23_00645 [Methylomonas sp.]PPD26419.1 MAG: hypothetical protein CTY22_05210 [Methylomonas sp.]PPD38168.1 MAG: hypothetical protein CTY21_05205 [Methylomonas sp.]PPD41844.1 MAG: hypothetical protein CTY17_02920 [Methylomonas sp.]PPD51604.1 MAG: hypothetical protein CTY11_11855 [Methylomonas sp.]